MRRKHPLYEALLIKLADPFLAQKLQEEQDDLPPTREELETERAMLQSSVDKLMDKEHLKHIEQEGLKKIPYSPSSSGKYYRELRQEMLSELGLETTDEHERARDIFIGLVQMIRNSINRNNRFTDPETTGSFHSQPVHSKEGDNNVYTWNQNIEYTSSNSPYFKGYVKNLLNDIQSLESPFIEVYSNANIPYPIEPQLLWQAKYDGPETNDKLIFNVIIEEPKF